jgi:hypothetical protein
MPVAERGQYLGRAFPSANRRALVRGLRRRTPHASDCVIRVRNRRPRCSTGRTAIGSLVRSSAHAHKGQPPRCHIASWAPPLKVIGTSATDDLAACASSCPGRVTQSISNTSGPTTAWSARHRGACRPEGEARGDSCVASLLRLAGTGDDVQAVPFVGMLHDQKLVAVGGVPPLLALGLPGRSPAALA